MGSRYLTDLADVCRAAGLIVHTEAGWETRARGSGGYSSGAPNHVMVHHTASNTTPANDVSYCCHGSENAPIANLYLARTGEVWVMAAGATNTNGSGTDPCGHVGPDNMNANAIGIEAANTGVGEPWPAVQQAAYVTLVAALCEHYGVPVPRIHAHYEYAPGRKIDPAGPARWPPINSSGSWAMDPFRADVDDADEPPPELEDEPMEIMVITTIAPHRPAMVRTGHTVSLLDDARYAAYHDAYPALVDTEHPHTDLANLKLIGPCPAGLELWHFWSP